MGGGREGFVVVVDDEEDINSAEESDVVWMILQLRTREGEGLERLNGPSGLLAERLN